MEVLLKKSKITKQILNQVRLITLTQIAEYRVLGWCYDGSKNNVSYIVFYSSRENILYKFPRKVRVEVQMSAQKTNRYYLEFYHNVLGRLDTDGDFDEDTISLIMSNIEKMQQEAEELGQFYI